MVSALILTAFKKGPKFIFYFCCGFSNNVLFLSQPEVRIIFMISSFETGVWSMHFPAENACATGKCSTVRMRSSSSGQRADLCDNSTPFRKCHGTATVRQLFQCFSLKG